MKRSAISFLSVFLAKRGGAVPLVAIALASTLLSHMLHNANWRWSRALDNVAIDTGFSLRGETASHLVASQPESKDILIVELNHQLPRSVLAALVHKLRFARVVALDLMLPDHDAELSDDEKRHPGYRVERARWNSENALLAASLRRANNVILGAWPERREVSQLTGGQPTDADFEWRKPTDAIWNAARWHAHLRVEPDPGDGIVRHVSQWQKVPFAPESVLPAFALLVAQSSAQGSAQGSAQSSAQSSSKFDRLPGNRLLIDYLGGRHCFEDEANRIVASRVLNDCDAEEFRGLTVFVGETAYSSKDVFPTPYGDLPGVHVQAHAAVTLRRVSGPPQEIPPALTLLLSFLSCLTLIFPLQRWPLWGATLGAFALALLLALGAQALFAWGGLIVPLGTPLFALLFAYNAMALWQHRRARSTLGRFIGADLVKETLSPLRDLHLGGRTECATAFFCDLRGYTALAENLPPERVAALLNLYTSTLVTVVRRWGGRPIDYLGDGVFVLFESARTEKRHAGNALRAALEAQGEFAKLAEGLAGDDEFDRASLQAAIAIHTGEMLIGAVGDENYLKLGAVGDAVNVAARVQNLAVRCGFTILATGEAVASWSDALPNENSPFQLIPCGHLELKGRQQPVEVFGVVSPHRSVLELPVSM